MKETGIVQAVIILLLLAAAASCEVSKDYSNRLFNQSSKEKAETNNIKFLQTDSITSSEIKEYKPEEKITVNDTMSIIPPKKEIPDSIKNKQAGVRLKKVRQ
jgi:hypothetical protein